MIQVTKSRSHEISNFRRQHQQYATRICVSVRLQGAPDTENASSDKNSGTVCKTNRPLVDKVTLQKSGRATPSRD